MWDRDPWASSALCCYPIFFAVHVGVLALPLRLR
jgi:hypothetical protein